MSQCLLQQVYVQRIRENHRAASSSAGIIPSWGIICSLMLHISISILIYTVGYMGLKQPEIFSQPAEVVSNDKQGNVEGVMEKYQKSGLSNEAADEIKEKLICSMQKDKHYLDSELTLNKLSGLLGVSQHNLSEVINLKLNQTYYDFINSYRVEEFKQLLSNPAYYNYSLLSIAFDAGFKSKTTFNTIFKKITGLTPSEYKSQLKNIVN